MPASPPSERRNPRARPHGEAPALVPPVEAAGPVVEPARVTARGSFSGPFGDLLVAAHEAIVLVDEQQRIIGFNPAAEALFGCSAAAALGSPLDRFVPAWARHRH